MLKEFAAKKCVKLGKLLEKGGIALDNKKKLPGGSSQSENCTPVKVNRFQFGDVLFFSYYCADFNLFFILVMNEILLCHLKKKTIWRRILSSIGPSSLSTNESFSNHLNDHNPSCQSFSTNNEQFLE